MWIELLFNSRGRITRAEFWQGAAIVLALCLITPLLWQLGWIESDELLANEGVRPGAIMMAWFLSFIAFWIWISICAKRCEARGKSPWWVVVSFVPVLGQIWAMTELGIAPDSQEPQAAV